VLFKRPKQLYFYINDPLLGWGARTEGSVEVHEVDTNHHEVLREPHVQKISKILVTRLGRTLITEPAARYVGASRFGCSCHLALNLA